jgi:hypothetical protein
MAPEISAIFSPVSTCAMSTTWSSEPEASSLPSWLKPTDRIGHSSLHEEKKEQKKTQLNCPKINLEFRVLCRVVGGAQLQFDK